MTSANQRPWTEATVMLHHGLPGPGTYGARCTGLLITPNLILTASHCGMTPFASFFSTDPAGSVYVGTVDMDTVNRFDLDYDPASNRYLDISIRKLMSPAPVVPYWLPYSTRANTLSNPPQFFEFAGYGWTGPPDALFRPDYLSWAGNCQLSQDVHENTGHQGLVPDMRFKHSCDFPDPIDTVGMDGDSGASVFSADGRLIGIHTNSGYDPPDVNRNTAMYLDYTDSGERIYWDWIYNVIRTEDPDYYFDELVWGIEAVDPYCGPRKSDRLLI